MTFTQGIRNLDLHIITSSLHNTPFYLLNFFCIPNRFYDLHRERLIDTRGYFLLLHDNRLFRPELHYIWNRIVNVVFIRRFNTYKYRSGERVTREQIDLNTVYYPSRTSGFTELKYIDTWLNGKLRYDNDHYISKTTNLRGNGLRLVPIFVYR